MEKQRYEAALEATSQSFLGRAEQTLKKRVLDKGKAVHDDGPKTNLDQKKLSLSPPKVPSTTLSLGMVEHAQKGEYDSKLKREELGPSFNICSHPKEGQFSTTQALGGHQNAHKQERELQKVMKAAQEFGKSPLMYNLLGMRPPIFPGSCCGYHLQNPPYPGYASKGWHAPINPTLGLGSSSVGQTPEGFLRPSAIRPTSTAYNSGWFNPQAPPLGSVQGTQGWSTNFDYATASNDFSMFSQAMKNEATSNKKQCTKSLGLDLSLKRNEYASLDLVAFKCDEDIKLEKSRKQDGPTEFDLTLKL
ncbi:hypothetical protein Cgig2_026583 [Carnegiea gigantea]|uniref:Uncharacterized protein n=1 Tax=Carnegiea gigantea TaxID=171969 RepID=A0A9Q1KIY6_9CARY|nr:hypothetical protein Cgig2_026583 [Carnegiea gigantea]